MNKQSIFIVFIVLFVSSCTTKYYTYSSNNYTLSEVPNKFKGKTIDFWGYDKNDPAVNRALSRMFSKFGFKEFVKKKGAKPDFLGVYRYRVNTYGGYNNVPVWGQTGIRSVNTNTYGNISRGINYGSYDYTGYSTSAVNYDYGITGYQTVPYISYNTSLELLVFEYRKNKESVIYQADMFIDDAVSLWKMASYLLIATEDYGFNKERVYMHLDCYKDEYKGQFVCEKPVGVLARMFSFL